MTVRNWLAAMPDIGASRHAIFRLPLDRLMTWIHSQLPRPERRRVSLGIGFGEGIVNAGATALAL